MEWFFPSLCPGQSGAEHLKIPYCVLLGISQVRKSGAAGENWLLKGKPSLFSPLGEKKKKKSTNASLLPLPLPAALIACRGWGGSGHSSSCWPVSWKLPPFSQSQPLLWRRQCGHTVSALCITWAPGPLTQGFYTVAHHLPTLPKVPPHPNQGASASPFPGLSRKKLHALFSQGLKKNMCNVIPGKLFR